MSHEETANKARPPTWLWRVTVFLLTASLAIGLVLVAALTLGWRSPTPRRSPDWTATDLMWTQSGDGSATFTNHGYRIRLSQPDQRAWSVARQPVADFEVELDLRSVTPNEDVGYGLLYRYQDQANFYLFAIGGDGYFTIALVRRGEFHSLRTWQQWPHIRRGATTNRLRIRCQGTLCRFHINDEFTAEVEDDTFLAGDLGFWAQSFSDEALDVIFEELRLWMLNQPKPEGPDSETGWVTDWGQAKKRDQSTARRYPTPRTLMT